MGGARRRNLLLTARIVSRSYSTFCTTCMAQDPGQMHRGVATRRARPARPCRLPWTAQPACVARRQEGRASIGGCLRCTGPCCRRPGGWRAPARACGETSMGRRKMRSRALRIGGVTPSRASPAAASSACEGSAGSPPTTSTCAGGERGAGLGSLAQVAGQRQQRCKPVNGNSLSLSATNSRGSV